MELVVQGFQRAKWLHLKAQMQEEIWSASVAQLIVREVINGLFLFEIYLCIRIYGKQHSAIVLKP